MALASRGLRDTGDGPTPVGGDHVERAVWTQARTVLRKAALLAAGLTLAVLLLP